MHIPVTLLAEDGAVERRYEKESARRIAVRDKEALSCHHWVSDWGDFEQCLSV